MATFSDNFDRTNASTLGASWTEDGNGWSIVSNQAKCDGSVSVMWWATACDSDDNYSEATAVTVQASGNRIAARSDGATTSPTFYAIRAHSTQPYICKVVTGTLTALGSDWGSVSAGNVLRFEAEGSTLTAYVNSSQTQQLTDTSITTGLYVGVMGVNTSFIVDDWSGGDLSTTQTVAVTAATETDAAVSVGRRKSKAVTAATETDAVVAVTARKSRAVTAATETDTVTGVTARKVKALGTAAEVDAAVGLTITGTTTVAVTAATESDAAVAVGRRKSRALGTAAETDTPTAVTQRKRKAVPAATESDAAVAVTRRKSRTLGAATETDAAVSVGRRKRRTLGTAAEVDTAVGVTIFGQLVVALGTATETDTAGAVFRALNGRGRSTGSTRPVHRSTVTTRPTAYPTARTTRTALVEAHHDL